MKIALIDPVGGKGGMDYYDYGLALGLSNSDIQVLYFTSFSTSLRKYEKVETHFSFKDLWGQNGAKKAIRLGQGYTNAFLMAKKADCSHVHFQFFHLGIQNILALICAKLFRLKTVVTIHDVDSFRKKESSLLQKVGYRLSDQIIVHNELSKRELLKKKSDLKNLHVIPHGNYRPFVPDLPKRDDSDGVLRLLFFGQIKDVKGLEVLLKAMKQVIKEEKNVHLTIAGKPWANENYDYPSLIEKLKLENFVTTRFDYIPNEEVERYFSNCDVVVLPYKRIYQSGVLLLSMSYGRVTLTSDLEAFKEIIKDEISGFLFENGNVEDLARVILKIKKKSSLPIVKQNAKELLEKKFDWTSIGKQTKKVYEEN